MIPFLFAGVVPAEFAKPVVLPPAIERAGLSIAQVEPAQSSAPSREDVLLEKFPYVSLQLGVGIPNNLTGVINNLENTTINMNAGFNGELAVGYKLNDFRTDLSLGYSYFGMNTQEFSVGNINSGPVPATGGLGLWTVMLNGYYDVPIRQGTGALSRWSPYLGGGIGYANLSLPECANAGACYAPGSAGAFAWQAKAGVSYRAAKQGYLYLEGGYIGAVGNLTINEAVFDQFGAWRINLGWRQGF